MSTGKRARPAKKPDFRVCPACGTRNKDKWELCVKCGEPLADVPLGMPAGAAGEAAAALPPLERRSWLPGLGAVAAVALLGVGVYLIRNKPQPFQGPDPSVFAMPTMPAQPPEPPSTDEAADATSEDFREGYRLLQAGNAPAAIPLLEKATAQDGTNALYRHALARAYWAVDRKDDAIAQFESAASIAGSTQYRLDLGHALEHAGRQAEAVQAYEDAIAFAPDSTKALEDLTALYMRTDQHARALPLLRRLTQLETKNVVAAQNLGLALEKSGDLPGAEAEFRRAVDAVPEAALTRTYLAEVQHKQGRPGEAVATLREGLERDPQAALLHRSLGSMLERTGKVAEAVQAYREYARLAPGSADAKKVGERAEKLAARAGVPPLPPPPPSS